MFKRTAILSILFLYLGTTVGFAMSLHFCGTKISNIKFNSEKFKGCCTDEAESKSDNCCKDKQIEIKVSDRQQLMTINKVPEPVNFDLFLFPVKYVNTRPGLSDLYPNLIYYGPPLISDVPFTIQYSVFRI